MSASIAERLRQEAESLQFHEGRPTVIDLELTQKSLRALAAELEQKAEDARAHGSHWRQPHQAYWYDLADWLAGPRREPISEADAAETFAQNCAKRRAAKP
jgi:hypothetical protein